MPDNSDSSPATADRSANTKPNREYEVGYGKPPAAHRFKHGNNANPKGRKKGSRSRKIVTRDVLLEPVTVREGGDIRQMPAIEAVLKRLLSNALAGDNKAAFAVIGIAQKEGILTAEQEQVVESLSESDQAIMADMKRRMEEAVPEQPLPSGQAAPDPSGVQESPTP